MSVLERLEVPIVLAPLAGGPSTPELAAAVSNGGGLGFLAGGYLTAGALEERIGALRELTDRPFGVYSAYVPGSDGDPGTNRFTPNGRSVSSRSAPIRSSSAPAVR